METKGRVPQRRRLIRVPDLATFRRTLAAGAVPNNPSEISGHPDSKWGGSVMAAL